MMSKIIIRLMRVKITTVSSVSPPYIMFMIKMDFAQCSYTSIPDTDDAMKPAAE